LRHVVTAVVALLGAQAAGAAELSDLAAAARSILGTNQGVYVEAADGTALLAQLADKPVHPASVSKVPTTLALLTKFGPEHRFVTTFAPSGRLLDGTLYGDVLVDSDGDPALVDEDALLVAEHFKQLGIRRVAGNVHLRSSLMFDWRSDSDGTSLRRALSGLAPPAAWAAGAAGDGRAATSRWSSNRRRPAPRA